MKRSTRSLPAGVAAHTQFDVALHRQEDVVRFDIAVNHTLGVQMLQPVQCLHRLAGNLNRWV
jgi:hypothetical protein